MSRILVASPEGAVVRRRGRLAAPPAALEGKRVAVLVNGKPNAGLLLSTVAEDLANKAGMRLGPVLGKRSAAEPADAEVLDNLRRTAEVVLTGSGD
ncbi:MAG TPA: hypothetical protein VKC52_00925 [Acidimicrobiia bacterium]|nr:hypothetical protein [Acidimicrobiia bacterium]